MRSHFVRILLTSLFVGAILLSDFTPASADEWGAWKESGSSECVFAGTNLITADTPNKHNIAVANSCEIDYIVSVEEIHHDSAGRDIDVCNKNSYFNYSECPIQASTLTGDYWTWDVTILIGTVYYGFSCSNNGGGYYDCYHTDDP
jgi:hypothetical protein